MIFEQHRWPLKVAWQKICHDHDEIIRYIQNQNLDDKVSWLIIQTPLPEDFVNLNMDGSFMEVENYMGGGLIRNILGKWLVGFMSYAQKENRFLAETCALCVWLTLAWSHGFKKIIMALTMQI